MNVKPLSDRVLILPNPAEEKTAGGLIIPDTAKEKPLAGKVIAVGPGTSKSRWKSKSAIRCFTASMPVRRSTSMARIT